MTGYKINMTDANDLIGALSKLGLSRRRSLNTEEQAEEHVTAYPTRFSHHVIRFVFPALDLVPDISTVILPEPKNIDYRSQPDALKHQLNQYNSEYCYAMDPNSVQPDIDALSANGHVMMLLRILDALASYEAESIISVVSHFFENQIQFRHQLESFAQGERNVYISDFTEQEWSILLSAPRLWIDLLGDVVFRSSARSYIAAEVTILAQDIVFYSRDFEKWRHRWNSANKNAGVRLSMRGQEIEVITTHDPDTRRAYHLIRLSCGHEIHTTAEEMQALMDDNSRISRLRCADCSELFSLSFV